MSIILHIKPEAVAEAVAAAYLGSREESFIPVLKYRRSAILDSPLLASPIDFHANARSASSIGHDGLLGGSLISMGVNGGPRSSSLTRLRPLLASPLRGFLTSPGGTATLIRSIDCHDSSVGLLGRRRRGSGMGFNGEVS